MNAFEFLEKKKALEKQLRAVQLELDALPDKVQFPADDELRPARPADIVEGRMIFYHKGDNGPFFQIVREIREPDDDFNAFMSEDGCIYGLLDAFVLKRRKAA